MIRLEHVSKYYKTETGVSEGMRDISVKFSLNEFVAITGESGSGKTTLLNVLSGLDSYEDGEVFINNKETSHFTIKEWEEFRAKNIGFVFQNYNVIDSYTVLENVLIALEAQGYNESNKKERALKLIEQVGLLSHKNQRTSKLSGGQKQRVVIARALAKNAPIILADEPTGNLDEKSGKEIMELLKEISKDKLIILVTHNFNEAKDYVTRNIVMSDGKIKEDIKLKDVEKASEDLREDTTVKNDVNNSLRLATRNLKATPKRTVFTLLLSMLSIFIFIFFYSSLIKNADITNNLVIANTLYVQERSEEDFNFKEFKSKYNDKQYIIEPVLKGKLRVKASETEQYSLNILDIVDENSIFEGRMPKNKNEILMSNLFFGVSTGHEINDKIKLPNIDEEFIIVGAVQNIFDSSGQIHPEFYFDKSFIFDKDYNLKKNIEESLVKELEIKEAVIIAKDRQGVRVFKDRIDSKKYQYIDPYLQFEKEGEFILGTLKFFFWLVLLGILSIVFLVLYNVQKNMMSSRKKDFAIYRSIGITEKEIAYTILFEQFIIAILASIVMFVTLNILGNNSTFFYNIIRNIKISDYIVISLIFSLFSLYQGLKYNKNIFNVTVIDSLKEGF